MEDGSSGWLQSKPNSFQQHQSLRASEHNLIICHPSTDPEEQIEYYLVDILSKNILPRVTLYHLLRINNMKLTVVCALFAVLPATSSAFTAQLPHTTGSQLPSTSLNLFGNKKEDDASKEPGMMQKLAMLKQMQELASKKKQIDDDLAKSSFEGVSADGKVKAIIKFVPSNNPMDPNPEIDATDFKFDAEWYESASPEDIAKGTKEAYMSGVTSVNQEMAAKYSVFQADMASTLGTLMK